jgi:hypothetical protein
MSKKSHKGKNAQNVKSLNDIFKQISGIGIEPITRPEDAQIIADEEMRNNERPE